MSLERVTITTGNQPGDASVVIDGVEVNSRIRSVTFFADAESFPTVELEYACFDVMVDGEATVVHYCPVSGEAMTGGAA